MKLTLKQWIWIGGGLVLTIPAAVVLINVFNPVVPNEVFISESPVEVETSESGVETADDAFELCKIDIPQYGDMANGVRSMMSVFYEDSVNALAEKRSITAQTRWQSMASGQEKDRIRQIAVDAALSVDLGHGIILDDIRKDIQALRAMISINDQPRTEATMGSILNTIDKLIAIESGLKAIEGDFETAVTKGWISTSEVQQTLAILGQDFVLVQTAGVENQKCGRDGSSYLDARDGDGVE